MSFDALSRSFNLSRYLNFPIRLWILNSSARPPERMGMWELVPTIFLLDWLSLFQLWGRGADYAPSINLSPSKFLTFRRPCSSTFDICVFFSFLCANARLSGFPLICILSDQFTLLKFIYSEKATKICEIFPLLLTNNLFFCVSRPILNFQ